MKSILFTIHSKYILIMFTAAFLLLVSCNGNKSYTSSPTEDSTTIVTPDTLNSVTGSSSETPDVDSIKDHQIKRNPASVDSALIPPLSKDSAFANKSKSRKAVFGFSFFRNMQEHETRNIDAYVSIVNGLSKVIDTLKNINANDIPVRKNDTATVFARNIFIFKALTVSVVNAGDSDFIIKAFAEPHQIIDSVNGNSWTWAVTPRTSKTYGRLIMNITAERPDGTHEPFNTINIPIIISLDKSINRTIWQWMMDNPEKVLTIILIPLIIFFWKQITGLFKKKDPEKKS
jgi:hypothetical protein